MRIFLFIFIMMLASCRIERKIYSPLPVNNPSLQEKNDFSAGASISSPAGFDLNGGFAITNRLAIIAGAYSHKNKDIEHTTGFTSEVDSSNLVYRHNGFTIGAGVFFPLGRGSSTFLSFYGGTNNGTFRMNEALYELSPNPSSTPFVNYYRSKLNRMFLQSSLNYYGGSYEASATIRCNFAEYKNVNTDYTNSQLENYRLPPFVSPRTSTFIDFSMEGRFYFSKDPRWGMHVFGVVSTRTSDDEDPATTGNYDYYKHRIGTGIFFKGFTGKRRK